MPRQPNRLERWNGYSKYTDFYSTMLKTSIPTDRTARRASLAYTKIGVAGLQERLQNEAILVSSDENALTLVYLKGPNAPSTLHFMTRVLG